MSPGLTKLDHMTFTLPNLTKTSRSFFFIINKVVNYKPPKQLEAFINKNVIILSTQSEGMKTKLLES